MDWVVALSVSAGFGALMGWVYAGFPGLLERAATKLQGPSALSAARDPAIRARNLAHRNTLRSYIRGAHGSPAVVVAPSIDGGRIRSAPAVVDGAAASLGDHDPSITGDPTSDYAAARYKTDGSPDTSFDGTRDPHR